MGDVISVMKQETGIIREKSSDIKLKNRLRRMVRDDEVLS